MKFTLLVVGRTVEKHYITAINDYVERTNISRKTKCSTFAKHFVPKSHLLTQFKM